MQAILKTFVRWMRNPRMELMAGIVLLCAGLFEAYETVLEEILGVHMRIHHGVIIYAGFSVLKSLTGLVEGAAMLEEAEKTREELKEIEQLIKDENSAA